MNNYKLDVVAKTLTITAAFGERIQNPDTEEYKLFLKLTSEIPGLTVLKKTHSTPKKYKTKSGEICHCNQFKNLKYENMERFILALPENKKYLREFYFLKNEASVGQRNRYTLVRRWFVAQFPEYRSNPLLYFEEDVAVVSSQEVLAEENEEVNVNKAS